MQQNHDSDDDCRIQFETIGYTSFINTVKPIEKFQLRLVFH